MSDLDNRTPEEIQAEIDRTRADLSETVDTIQDRVSPENLRQQVTGQAQDAIQEIKEAVVGKIDELVRGAGGNLEDMSSNVLASIKENPVPAALIGVGISWLVMSARNRPSHPQVGTYPAGEGYRDQYTDQSRLQTTGWQSEGQEEQGGLTQKAGQAFEGAKERARQVGDQVRDRAEAWTGEAEGWRDRAGEMSAGLAEQAQQRVQQAEQGFERMLQENPLAVGAIALAVGAAIGLALPGTRREDELMGETRDQLVERAQDVAQKAVHVAERTAEAVVETVKEEAERQGLSSDAEGVQTAVAEAVRDTVHKARDVAEKTAEAAKETAREEVQKARDVAEKAAQEAKETAREEAKKEGLE